MYLKINPQTDPQPPPHTGTLTYPHVTFVIKVYVTPGPWCVLWVTPFFPSILYIYKGGHPGGDIPVLSPHTKGIRVPHVEHTPICIHVHV